MLTPQQIERLGLLRGRLEDRAAREGARENHEGQRMFGDLARGVAMALGELHSPFANANSRDHQEASAQPVHND